MKPFENERLQNALNLEIKRDESKISALKNRAEDSIKKQQTKLVGHASTDDLLDKNMNLRHSEVLKRGYTEKYMDGPTHQEADQYDDQENQPGVHNEQDI